MSLTIAPSDEAAQAIVDRIDSGTAYSLDVAANYSRVEISPLDEIDELKVDVVVVSEEQLNETFAIEDRTSHKLVIWIRDKLPDREPETIAQRTLLARQIYQRVNNWDSTDGRVKVWDADKGTRMTPDKNALDKMGLFVAKVVLRVEVEPPT